MTQICTYGGANLRPSGTGKQPLPFNLIIYVHCAALPCPAGVSQVCTQLEQLGTSGDSPTALCGGLA